MYISPDDISAVHALFARMDYREEQRLRRFLVPEFRAALWKFHTQRFLDTDLDSALSS